MHPILLFLLDGRFMEPYKYLAPTKKTEAPRGEIGLTVFWRGVFCVKAVLIGSVGLHAAYFSDFRPPVAIPWVFIGGAV